MKNVKLVFGYIGFLWRFRHFTKLVPAQIDRKEVSLVGTYSQKDIELAQKMFNAKVLETRK
jgi:hypothetical protein